MQFRYVLLMAMATLAATTDARVTNRARPTRVEQVQDEHEFVRSLLADDDASLVKNQGSAHFMEHKLQKALTNPKKTQKLYEFWYKKGYSVKQVSSDLGQSENRELSSTYTKISKGYAAFLKQQQ
ncbi:hypothetical protein P3T76_007636 [Phytophthora citrophthora]|uniref:RxLR effector protein n=1 Tax=Phytophthora citrophthora TaxID=4793 RepID=A0AAD9GLV5_9STRA|nr:hypothetical protein P3T76_007636 [Phytophthora citrophthora]